MKPAYVWSQSAWMPGRAGADAVLEMRPPDADQLQPDMASFPSRLMRGTSPTTRSLVWVARDALRQASVQGCTSVFGSAFGEASIAIRQLEMMISGDGKLSPTLFKNSVHNTAGGVMSVADRNHAPSTSVAAGELSVAMALLEAQCLIDAGAPSVLVAVGDESLPEPLSQLGVWPTFAAAWVLGASPPPGGEPAMVFDGVVRMNGALGHVPSELGLHPCRSAFVVLDAVAAFLVEDGTVVDRVVAGMEAADQAGGDSRCSCRTDPVPETETGCRHRTAHVAYVTAAKADDPIGSGHSDGAYSLFIDVDDENTAANESANPVETLRMRYDEWKAEGGLEALGLGAP